MNRELRTLSFAVGSFVVMTAFSGVARAQNTRTWAVDSAAVQSTVEHFHSALAGGDSASAVNLLADDVIVLESGELEHRASYLGHHLPADIKFAKALPSTRVTQRVTVAGDAAWVVGTSATNGTYDGRAIKSAGAELMVLRRTSAGWRIAAIHWSSHRAR